MIMDKTAVKFVYNFIHTGKIPIDGLNAKQINSIQHNCVPRLPGIEFPEDYPDENGDSGLAINLYRGFYFTEKDDYLTFLKSIKSGYFSSTDLHSWSRIQQVASEFAEGAGQPSSSNYYGVVLQIEAFTELHKTLFCTQRAYTIIESEFEYNDVEWEEEAEYLHWQESNLFYDESEVVLMPGTYAINIVTKA